VVETLAGFAASPPVLVGLFVGLTAWLARAVLRAPWVRTSIVVIIAISVMTAGGLLVALRAWTLTVPGLAGYGLGLLVSSLIYVSLYRLSEGHWPVRNRPMRTSD
jgi:hypothetical protein